MSNKCKCSKDKVCICKTNGAVATNYSIDCEAHKWSILNFEAFAEGMIKHAEKHNKLLKPRVKQ